MASSWVETAVPGCLRDPDPPWQPALRSISSLEEVVVAVMEVGGLETPPRPSIGSLRHISPKKKTHQSRNCLSASVWKLTQAEARYPEWQQFPLLHSNEGTRKGNALDMLWESPKFNHHWLSLPVLSLDVCEKVACFKHSDWCTCLNLWLYHHKKHKTLQARALN